MLELIVSAIAISSIAMTCRIAGRIPAMMLTAVAAASAAMIMPPFASWQVESNTDILTLVLQTIIGLAFVYRSPVKNRQKQLPVITSFERPGQSSPSLHTLVQAAINHESTIAGRSDDIEICGELHDEVGASHNNLETILSDVLRVAMSNPGTLRVRIHTGHRPGLDYICVVAQPDSSASLPRIRIVGRSDSERPLRAKGWPTNCSATVFDNGFEQIYQISIQKPF